jgi:hypothetical protein
VGIDKFIKENIPEEVPKPQNIENISEVKNEINHTKNYKAYVKSSPWMKQEWTEYEAKWNEFNKTTGEKISHFDLLFLLILLIIY